MSVIKDSEYSDLVTRVFVISALGAFILAITRYAYGRYDHIWIVWVGVTIAILAMVIESARQIRHFTKSRSSSFKVVAKEVYAKAFKHEHFKVVHIFAISLGAIIGTVFGSFFSTGTSLDSLHLGSVAGAVVCAILMLLLVGTDKQADRRS